MKTPNSTSFQLGAIQTNGTSADKMHTPAIDDQVMMVTAISTYLIKILVLLFFVVRYSGTTAFNGKAFGFTVVVCVIVYTTAQALVSARLKVPYVEPDGKR